MLVIGLVLLWIGSGIFTLIMDWTRDFDMHGDDLLAAILCGTLIGPIAIFLYGYNSGKSKVVFKRRK